MAVCTYWDELKDQALILLSRVTFLTCPPWYSFGGPMDSSLSSKYLPSSPLNMPSVFSLMTRVPSVYRRMYLYYVDLLLFCTGLIHTSGLTRQDLSHMCCISLFLHVCQPILRFHSDVVHLKLNEFCQ